MSNSEWSRCIALAGRLALAYAFIFGQTAAAGQNQVAKSETQSSSTSATQPSAQKQSSTAATTTAQTEKSQTALREPAVMPEKSSTKGSHEGIKVHGHWTIEVRNPDGTVVSHRQFENSLTVDGATIIAGLLSRSVSAGFWEVILANVGGTQPCFNGNAECTVYEAGLGNLSDAFPTLSVSLGTGANGATVILSGTATAGVNSAINQVGSLMFDCSNTTAPSAPCNITNPGRVPGQVTFNVTVAQVNPAITVSTGQTIAVTVIISLS